MRKQVGILLNRICLDYFYVPIGHFFYCALERIRTHRCAFKRIGTHSSAFNSLKKNTFLLTSSSNRFYI